MANHQNNYHQGVDGHTPRGTTTADGPASKSMFSASEDDIAADADEPPDKRDALHRRSPPSTDSSSSGQGPFRKTIVPPSDHRLSLLTEALLSHSDAPAVSRERPHPISKLSVESNPSAASTGGLTSDGGLSSPARTNSPSPPLPLMPGTIIIQSDAKSTVPSVLSAGKDVATAKTDSEGPSNIQESTVEARLGRKRCITFACGRKENPKAKVAVHAVMSSKVPSTMDAKATGSQVPPNTGTLSAGGTVVFNPSGAKDVPGPEHQGNDVMSRSLGHHRDSESTVRGSSPRSSSQSLQLHQATSGLISPIPQVSRIDIQRFYEFASSVEEEDEWMHEPTIHRHRITVDDTLKKEKAIRKLGEEAEAEALQDEELDDDQDPDDDNDGEDNEEEDDNDNDEEAVSDDGNETDDEGGFAESDNESIGDSDYDFWRPGVSTAATSIDQLDRHRRVAHRSGSQSSVDSVRAINSSIAAVDRPSHKTRRKLRRAKIRPGTPELPDSTDFVCGTLDEDRPLEDAYVSCMEERKRSMHTAVPQDIDPSFPTSDPDDEDDDDDAPELRHSDENVWINGRPDDSCCESTDEHAKVNRKRRSPLMSPRRHPSPPPPPKRGTHHSPPSRRAKNASPIRGSPPLKVPPLMRKDSANLGPQRTARLRFAPIERIPGILQTKSLPRTPTAFHHRYMEDLSAMGSGDDGSRGPITAGANSRMMQKRGAIDIVKGLEKRQRWKEKARQKQCQLRAAKMKDRKPQPGRGAERMRELGLEMAGKGKGIQGLENHRAQYVLSI